MSGAVQGRDPVHLLTAAQAEALDARARHMGVPERALMESAGRAAAHVVDRLFPIGPVVAVVGSGNNGGDALVVLRTLLAWGRDVAWVPAGSRDPDPALLTGFELPRLPAADAPAAFARAAVLVDGILGTGAAGAPREPAAGLIRAMNGSGRPIVALDIPSGVDPTTGAVPAEAIVAAVTVQFGWPKTGALFHPGRARCGRLLAVEIGFPPVGPGEAAARLITPDWARARLPARAPDAHKNSVGRVLVVAGREGMGGAAVIAGLSALRAGAGYVRVASIPANRVPIQTAVPEALFVDRSDRAALRDAVSESDAVLIGPGLGTDDEAAEILDLVLGARHGAGCVLDADALTILAGRDGGVSGLGEGVLLTPHPGEMARLTGDDVPALRAEPMAAAERLATEAGVAVLLKGSPSVVASPDGQIMVSAVGSSDLATAAMGDQLGAAAAAFLAAGAPPADAAGLALFYGGRAAELAGRGRALLPTDVAQSFHLAFRDPGPARSDLDLPFIVFDQPARW
jgi:ADP-dependent NAD(P)H-hydrate dehydratase / NAD(P)H-hydrate epimerase